MSDNITKNIINSLVSAIVVINNDNEIIFMNDAAEAMFWVGFNKASNNNIFNIIKSESLEGIIKQSREHNYRVLEHNVFIKTPRSDNFVVTIEALPLIGSEKEELCLIFSENVSRKIATKFKHKNIIKSASSMASILAHEIRNPLSGVRGAAQLLEQTVSEHDKPLTKLIRIEVDRIAALIDRMSLFSDNRPLECEPINIHSILSHAKQVAQNGFASHVKFIEEYDPSLPSVMCNRDKMIQVFINLFKNAAEAVNKEDGFIKIKTAFRHGERVEIAEGGKKTFLPLVVSIEDNGSGISDNIKKNMFDPFVTEKQTGSGLGLAIVAKIIQDHGGVIDFSSEKGRTVFDVFLPIDKING